MWTLKQLSSKYLWNTCLCSGFAQMHAFMIHRIIWIRYLDSLSCTGCKVFPMLKVRRNTVLWNRLGSFLSNHTSDYPVLGLEVSSQAKLCWHTLCESAPQLLEDVSPFALYNLITVWIFMLFKNCDACDDLHVLGSLLKSELSPRKQKWLHLGIDWIMKRGLRLRVKHFDVLSQYRSVNMVVSLMDANYFISALRWMSVRL